MQDAGADLIGEVLQDDVVVFAGVGDADQALFGRGQQQRPDRAVDGAVGDVEQAVALGRGRESEVEVGQFACSGLGDSGQVVDNAFVTHGSLLSWARRPR